MHSTSEQRRTNNEPFVQVIFFQALSPNFTVFGHHTDTRSFTPPRGGIPAPYNSLNQATEDFSRPGAATKTFILGVLYRDNDTNNAWTPRNIGDPLREGQGNKNFNVYNAGTATLVTSGSTLSTGSFSIQIGNGTYDIVFSGLSTPLGTLRAENVVLSGQNVDAGDYDLSKIAKADFNGDRHVDADDLTIMRACSTRSNVPYSTGALPAGCPGPYFSNYIVADFDQDGDVDSSDFAVFQRCYSGPAIANPSCG